MADKKPFRDVDREERDGPYMDNPEQFKTDKKSINEMYEEQLTVDDIPLEELKQNMHDEEHEHLTKENSSSEEKYKNN